MKKRSRRHKMPKLLKELNIYKKFLEDQKKMGGRFDTNPTIMGAQGSIDRELDYLRYLKKIDRGIKESAEWTLEEGANAR